MSLYYPGALQYEKLDATSPFGVVSKETGYLEITGTAETQITVTKLETSSVVSTGNYLIVSQNSDSTSSTPNAFSFSGYSRVSILVKDDKLLFGSSTSTKTEYTVNYLNNEEFEELSTYNKYHFTSTTLEISSIPEESSAIVYSASSDSYKIYEINAETEKLFITNNNDKTSTITKTKAFIPQLCFEASTTELESDTTFGSDVEIVCRSLSQDKIALFNADCEVIISSKTSSTPDDITQQSIAGYATNNKDAYITFNKANEVETIKTIISTLNT